ncbi:MAG: trigger factor [Sedimentisphaerales bacterium]|nr:trigger factor [Sedimentisphaerales bacterium]
MADDKKAVEQQNDVVDEQNNEEEEAKLDCKVTIEDSGAWKKKIVVEIPRAEIDKELDKQYGEFRTSAEVPGFRKGRAPRRLLEKRYGDDVLNQAKLRLMSQAFDQIDEAEDFEVMGEPDFDPDKLELPAEGDFKFDYEVEIKPKFDLPELEKVKVEKPLFEVTEERMTEAIDTVRRRHGKVIDVEGASAEEDMVLTDVTMKVDGIEDPEVAENRSIRVGATVLMNVTIEDLAKKMTGVKVGDTVKCAGEVPDTHPTEDYRGKKAEFSIVIKELHRLQLAEMNEEFFHSLGIKDEAELRKHIEEGLEEQADREQRNVMRQQIYEYLNDKVDFELPEGVAARHAARMLQRRYYDLLNQGVPNERIQENLEQLQASSNEQSARELKMSFIMERVAEELEVTVGDGEVNGFIAQVAANYGRRPERLRDEMQRSGRLDSLRDQIRDEKAIDKILEMAEVVDAPAETAKEKTSSDKSKSAAKPKAKKAAAKKETDSDSKQAEAAKKRTPPAKKKTKKDDEE